MTLSVSYQTKNVNKSLKGKIWMIMKLTIALLLFFIFQVNAKSYSQKITIVKNNIHLSEVFKSIEQQTGFHFFYDREVIQKTAPIDVTLKDATLERALSTCLKGQQLTFNIVRNTVVISAEKAATYLPIQAKATPTLIQDPEPPPIEIHGKIRDENGNPLIHASVIIKGTNEGVTTNKSGDFTINVPDNKTVLVISFIGYTTQEILLGDRTIININLLRINNSLDEVVVTSLGIKKERRALGYSLTEVKGDQLTQARETNVANSLIGKVAGLNVSPIAGGEGASTNVIIRGISSLGGTNQPLYVINGIPMENVSSGVGGAQYGGDDIDRGDAIGNINPDDIQSISVLKGSAASALYGYRAKAGVILITTKSPSGGGVEFSSNFVAERIINPTHFQYVYGQGTNNMKPPTQDAAFQSGQSSWGALLDGSEVVQFDGVSRPYVGQRDNLEKFYRTGGTLTNTIAFNKAFDNGGIRLSASDLKNESVMPNSGLNRQTFDFTGKFSPIKRLAIDATANYILEQAKNRPVIGDTPGNANYGVMIIANSVDINTLKKETKPDGSELGAQENTFATNPWFAAYKFINNTARQRLISSVRARYSFDNGLFFQGRVGRDAYTDRYTQVIPTGTAYEPAGEITEGSVIFSDLNIDGLAGKSFRVNNKFTITPNLGGSYRRTKSEEFYNNGARFAVPFVYNILNTENKIVNYLPSDLEVQSLYGTLEFAYGSYLYLTATSRSDWFSTLATPGVNNKLNIVYPSLSGSFVFSKFVSNNWLSFGKLRAGYAVVGQATDPFQTQLAYSLNSVTLNGLPLGSISNSSVPNRGLRPSKASELEIGTELRLFDDRIEMDLTWYSKESSDEIIPAPSSITSGYNGAVLNIGQLENKGFEALISAKILKFKNFSWTSSINGSINQNKVISLTTGQSQLPGGTSRSGVGFTASIVGLPADQIMAYDNKYDNSGKIALDANGVPARGNLIPFGSAYPKWIAGWNNEFSFKHFNLSFLIDGKFGGKIFSTTDYNAYRYGLHKATLVDREKNWGTAASPIYAQSYYTTLAKNVSKLFVFDDSFIKFRQLIFGYTFPSTMFNHVVKSMTVSLVARNLFILMKKTDNFDPEANYSSTPGGLTEGLENGGVPFTRSFGVNLNAKF